MSRLLLCVILTAACGVANSGRVPEVSETGCPPTGGHRDPTGAKTFDSTEVDRDALVADDVPEFHSPVQAGHVVARFVIDSSGLADLRTLTIEDSPDTALARAVRAYIPETHFIPAELHGCRVRVWARWPFTYLSGAEVQT
ncbi:MAG TPA: hypothetical protein VH438_01935 [Gemmatimonadales bacterium]|jgi:hypothetical protein